MDTFDLVKTFFNDELPNMLVENPSIAKEERCVYAFTVKEHGRWVIDLRQGTGTIYDMNKVEFDGPGPKIACEAIVTIGCVEKLLNMKSVGIADILGFIASGDIQITDLSKAMGLQKFIPKAT